jgi:WD40 repeat protein
VLNEREADRAKGRAEREATVANARRLAAQAVARARSAPDLALMLGLEAQRLRDSSESRGALLTVLQRTANLQRLVTGFPRDEIVSGLSADGRTLALSDTEGRVRLVDFATRAQKQSFATDQRGPVAVRFAPDDRTVATTSADTTARLWNRRTGQPLSPMLRGHRFPVLTAEFSPDSQAFVTEDIDGFGIVWEVPTGRLLANVPEIIVSVGNDIAWSPDGRRLAVSGIGTAVFDVPSMTKVFDLTPEFDSPHGALAFSPNGALLAVASRNVIELWDLESGRSRPGTLHAQPGTATFIYRLAFSPDGSKVAGGMFNGTVTVWDTDTGLVATEPLVGHRTHVTHLRFVNGSSDLVTASETDAASWSLEGRDPLASPGQLDNLAGPFVIDADFSRDGRLVAFGDVGGGVTLADAETLEPAGAPLQVGTANIEGYRDGAVALSADGRVLAVGVANGEARAVDVDTRAVRPAPVAVASLGIWDLSFSPDARLVAAGGADGSVTLIDARDWTVRRRASVHQGVGPVYVDFNADGRVLATGGSDGRVVLEDTATGRRRVVVRRESPVSAVHFSPDGRYVAAGFIDGAALIIDVARGRPVGASLVGLNGVFAARFSPDSRTLAVGGASGTVALWDIATRERLGQDLVADSSDVTALAFAPDGKTLTTVGLDGALVRWNLDLTAWTKRACDLAARNLTRAEWRDHIGDEPYRRTCQRWPAA